MNRKDNNENKKAGQIIHNLSGIISMDESQVKHFNKMLSLLGELREGVRFYKPGCKLNGDNIIKIIAIAAQNEQKSKQRNCSYSSITLEGGTTAFPKFWFGENFGETNICVGGKLSAKTDNRGNLFLSIKSAVNALYEVTTTDKKSGEKLSDETFTAIASLQSDVRDLIDAVIAKIEALGTDVKEGFQSTQDVVIAESGKTRAQITSVSSDIKTYIDNALQVDSGKNAERARKEAERARKEAEQARKEAEQAKKKAEKLKIQIETFNAPRYEKDGSAFVKNAYIAMIVFAAMCFVAGLAVLVLSYVDGYKYDYMFILFNPPWRISFIILNSVSVVSALGFAICLRICDGNWLRRHRWRKFYAAALVLGCIFVSLFFLLESAQIIPSWAHWVPLVFWLIVEILWVIYELRLSDAGKHGIVVSCISLCLIGILFGCSCVSVVAGAYVFFQQEQMYIEYEGITDDYILYRTLDDGTLAVAVYKYDSESLVIPAQIGEKAVTRIESSEYVPYNADTDMVKEITIPDSVTSIGDYAFSGCTSLTSVTFENTSGWQVSETSDFTNYISISSAALSNASTAAEYLTSTYCDYYWRRV